MRDFYLPAIATLVMVASALATEIPAACPLKDMPHECNCAYYYTCRDGKSILKQCKNGLNFDEIKGVCTLPEDVNCGSRTSRTTAPLLLDTDNTFDISLTECPSYGAGKLPHHCLCDRYYICNNGEASLQLCPKGTKYDYIRQICDYNVNCIRPIPTPTIPPTTTTTPAPIECDGTCIRRDTDPKDCAWYYECNSGRKVHQKCHEGLRFNPSTLMCDLPQYVKCQCPETADAESYCTCPGTTGDRRPHECQCNRYYECDNGKAIAKSCPSRTAYNRETHECDSTVVCDKSPSNKLQDAMGCIGTCPVHNSERRPPVTYLPHKECTNFCYCDKGTPFAYECSKGFHFSHTHQNCTDPAIAQCVSPFTHDGEDQESTKAKETSFWSHIHSTDR